MGLHMFWYLLRICKLPSNEHVQLHSGTSSKKFGLIFISLTGPYLFW